MQEAKNLVNPEEETQTVEEAKSKLKPSSPKEPLIKGFRNETVVLPLALLQRNVTELERAMNKGLQDTAQGNMQLLQYMMQALAPIRKQVAQIDRTLEAFINLSPVTDEQLQAEIDKIVDKEQAEQAAEEDKRLNRVEVDRAAQMGDVVNINYVGQLNGQVFEGGSAKNFHLELGSNKFVPGFEDQLVGMETGKTKDIKVTFPEDYGNEDLKGKEVTFTVTVNAVKEVRAVEEDFQEGK